MQPFFIASPENLALEGVGGELLIYTLNQGVKGSSKFGRAPKFGFENPLPFFNLLQPSSI